MTAKEQLLELVEELTELEAKRALRLVKKERADDGADDPAEGEMASLPKSWRVMANGDPMPNIAAAVRRSRVGH